MKETTVAPSLERFAAWLNFDLCGDDDLRLMVAGCCEWAHSFKSNHAPRWISLLGRSGTGKTHCAEKLWRWASVRADFNKAEYHPHAVLWPVFVQELRAGKAFEKRTDMQTWPVLFLDDIGAERDPTGFAAEELQAMLARRLGKWTIITSNRTIEKLAEVDERIASRLIRGSNICVGVKAPDYATR